MTRRVALAFFRRRAVWPSGIFALTIRPFPGWGGVLASGLIGILLAVYLWSSMPVAAAWVLGVLLGILLISEGLALTNLAWRVRTS